ncbi:MAG TPA: MBL fold metallo-hydrolase [Candidatus Binataceae bacterium]|jgi:glyoxylase-like metal-dependent hydrolase (beta-lactamase superfamily II)|nr:MBL fold metallo-hydrolase [Candidatus Binataceae bacterium]
MEKPIRVVKDSMIGIRLPDYSRHTPIVASVLGKNPGPFTGPGTNTYLVGRGPLPLILDTGAGVAVYPDLLARGLAELCRCSELEKIVVTHAHGDHLGGVRQIRPRFGDLEVFKMPWPEKDTLAGTAITPLRDGDQVTTEGATLRAVFTPGHAPDHLCYYLEEERAIFTGDVILGAGTTVIPDDTGDLGQYMASLRRLLELEAELIYPAHGPVIRDAQGKIREYIAHRELREQQVLEALSEGPLQVMSIVKKIYIDVPEFLHNAAASSVRSHLRKLQKEGVVVAEEDNYWRHS